jgi:uncharacterized protein
MSAIDQIPAVVRILCVFVLILWAIHKKFTLGTAFLAGSVVLGIVFGLDFGAIAKSIFASLTHPKTISLAGVVTLILVLSHSMEKAGQMTRLLDAFQGLVRHAGINIIIFPALIGLLPMPGGAIFSAPMVKNIGMRRDLSGAQLSYVNYWFRHIWEYWWPLYPGVLLTTALAGLDLWIFIIFLFPLTIVAILAGYLPLGRSMQHNPEEDIPASGRRQWLTFTRELAPILIAIVCGLGLGVVLSVSITAPQFTVAKETGLIIALVLAIGWVWRTNRFSLKDRWSIICQWPLLRMFYMVAGILIFQGILTDSQAVNQVSQELIRWRIPLTLIAILLPFLIGGVVGIPIAFVGTTFPILISLIQSLELTHLMLPYMMLALVSGFVGVLLSPLHLCLLMSNEYFQTSLAHVYRYLMIPCAALLLSGCAYFWVLYHFA